MPRGLRSAHPARVRSFVAWVRRPSVQPDDGPDEAKNPESAHGDEDGEGDKLLVIGRAFGALRVSTGGQRRYFAGRGQKALDCLEGHCV